MPKANKLKLNLKDRVKDTVCDLSLSELSEVPVREIASWKRVVFLDLSNNRLITLGKNFTTLTRLTKLDLSKNQIKFLPEDFGQLENLRDLDLYDNKLEHIPLSFWKLKRLRYLDLKGNPLTVSWAKIVGHCLTTEECQTAAKNVVSTCGELQVLADREIQVGNAMPQHSQSSSSTGNGTTTVASTTTTNSTNATNITKKGKKNKKKQKLQQQQSQKKNFNENGQAIDEGNLMQQHQKPTGNNIVGGHPGGVAVAASAAAAVHLPNNNKSGVKRKNNSNNNNAKNVTLIALKTIVTFLFFLAINGIIVYVVTFKNPEAANALIEYIPQQYRNWILTKSEVFRLSLSDWISKFRTTPEEH